MTAPETPNPTTEPRLRGYLVEFETPDALLAAAEKVRDDGWSKWDTFTPFPIHGMDAAMGIKATKLPLFVFGGGATGFLAGMGLQWWTNAVDYPFIISGKPLFGLPAAIPVVFELTILLAAFGAFFGMIVFNRLPMFYHPVFQSVRFTRVTDDRFFLAVDAEDARFDETGTRDFLETLGGSHVEVVDE